MKVIPIKELLFMLVIASSQIHAQNSSNANQQFPTNAASYCLDIEQSITKYFRLESDKAGKTFNAKNLEERKIEQTGYDFAKKQRKEYEETWQIMNCAVILYGKK